MPRTPVQPDSVHRLRLMQQKATKMTIARISVFAGEMILYAIRYVTMISAVSGAQLWVESQASANGILFTRTIAPPVPQIEGAHGYGNTIRRRTLEFSMHPINLLIASNCVS